jgi:hypothetical protein
LSTTPAKLGAWRKAPANAVRVVGTFPFPIIRFETPEVPVVIVGRVGEWFTKADAAGSSFGWQGTCNEHVFSLARLNLAPNHAARRKLPNFVQIGVARCFKDAV